MAFTDKRNLVKADEELFTNTASVFLHIEKGLRTKPHELAVICLHQTANHLENNKINGKSKKPERHENGVKPQNESESESHNSGYLTLTYTQLHQSALRLADRILKNGFPNSTVLLLIQNGAEYAIILWACTILRLPYVSLDLAYLDISKLSELADMLNTLNPSVIAVPDAAGSELVDSAINKARMPSNPLRILLSQNSKPPGEWTSFEKLLTHSNSPSIFHETLLEVARNDEPTRIHSILFTSGTSGRPKGCPIEVRGMTHMLHSQSWLLTPSNSHRALQLAHNSRGIAPQQTFSTWRVGGTVVMTGRGFVVQDAVDAIRKVGVSFLAITPAMVHGIAAEINEGRLSMDELQSVKTVMVGGDAVTKDVLLKCASLLPKGQICVNHGMTEGGGSFYWPFFDTPIEEVPFFGEICPIGKVATGGVVKIWDGDLKRVCERGVPGELHLNSGSLIRGYLGGVGADTFYEDSEGRRWFKTGDVAMMSDEGLVYILGRKKDRIVRGNGEVIMPAVIESCLEKYTNTQCVVVPIPHHDKGDAPLVVLRSYNGKSEEEIRSHSLEVLGQNYELADMASLKQLGLKEFPVNATHKVIKSKVREVAMNYLRKRQLVED
ncbi:putative amp dependent CoA ligase [Delitschia confertaspora ATCC 74209]|uniref:Amp dependent CoA ligase n=1 Tax=Delitschia confertaspora ATCC 74209 TaxID=1513339 RepID=A0A9P4JBF9_9PLEO|nr:putative amp dependent CoA ligase [Delitschia confertaspora ATCC 74209]